MIKFIKKNGSEERLYVFSRNSYADFIKKHYGINLSQVMMTEAIVSCNGKD